MTLSEASTPQDRIMQQSPEGRPYNQHRPGAEDVILSEAASVSEPRSRRLVLPALSRVEGSAVERNLGVADICSARRMELCNSLNKSLLLSHPGQLRPTKLASMLLCEVPTLPPSRTTKFRSGGRRRLRYEARVPAKAGEAG